MGRLQRLATLTMADWSYLVRAAFELLCARYRFSNVPPSALVRELRSPSRPSEPVVRSAGAPNIDRLSWAIATASRLVPWRSDCLIQVLAADRWLQRYGLTGDFYLGVAKDEDSGLKAHAWLRFGDLTVAGGRCDEFVPLIAPDEPFAANQSRRQSLRSPPRSRQSARR